MEQSCYNCRKVKWDSGLFVGAISVLHAHGTECPFSRHLEKWQEGEVDKIIFRIGEGTLWVAGCPAHEPKEQEK